MQVTVPMRAALCRMLSEESEGTSGVRREQCWLKGRGAGASAGHFFGFVFSHHCNIHAAGSDQAFRPQLAEVGFVL